MSRWRYNGEQLAAIDAWAEASTPHELVYLPRLRGDGAYEVMAVILDEDQDPMVGVAPILVAFLEIHPDGKITQTDGVIRWDEEGCEGP